MKVGSRIPSTPVQQLIDGEIKQINLADFSQVDHSRGRNARGIHTHMCR